MDLLFPASDPALALNTIPSDDDFIIHVSDDNCQRFEEIQDAVKADPDTQDTLNAMAYDMQESGFFDELRRLT